MNDIINYNKHIIDSIGFFGPLILLVTSIIKLWNQPPYLAGYLIFFIINVIINKILKSIIKEPRPANGQSIINESYEGADKYGMPSSHAQSVFYSMTYVYLIKDDYLVLLFESFISFLTIYQRWNYRRHTIEQLGIGSMIGLLFAYIGVYITKKYIHFPKYV